MERIQLEVVIPLLLSALSLPGLVLSWSKSSLTTPCLHGTAHFSQPCPWWGKITPEPHEKKPVLLSCSPLFIQQAALYTRKQNYTFFYTPDEVRLTWSKPIPQARPWTRCIWTKNMGMTPGLQWQSTGKGPATASGKCYLTNAYGPWIMTLSQYRSSVEFRAHITGNSLLFQSPITERCIPSCSCNKNPNFSVFLQTASESLLSTDHDRIKTVSYSTLFVQLKLYWPDPCSNTAVTSVA